MKKFFYNVDEYNLDGIRRKEINRVRWAIRANCQVEHHASNRTIKATKAIKVFIYKRNIYDNNHPLTYIMPLDEVVNGEVAKPRWNVIEEEDDGVELRRPIVSLLVEFVANAPAISEQQERLRL